MNRDSNDHRLTGDLRTEGKVIAIVTAGENPVVEVDCDGRTVRGRPSRRMIENNDIEFRVGDTVAILVPPQGKVERICTIIHRAGRR